MSVLNVDLGERGYPIHIGRGLLEHPSPLIALLDDRDVMIVSNETVAPLYMADTMAAASNSRRVHTLVLPDGESYKTLDVLNQIYSALLGERFGRDVVLLALGGGVIGDIVGFAAASYQRGVDFVQVPTTLLAQVDSSVGGKTAVNHELGKNMIGAFHQPIAVVADTATLDTLPDRELHAGLAEVVKYGLICDLSFFEWLESSAPALLSRDDESLIHVIKRSCEIKAETVRLDERETGRRALLNLGHTFGHAIETGMGYGHWLHGEAVSAGISMAADLSQRLSWMDALDRKRSDNLLESLSLPVRGPAELSPQRMHDLMMVDKKVAQGQLRLVLLKRIGEAVLTDDFDEASLFETLRECREHN